MTPSFPLRRAFALAAAACALAGAPPSHAQDAAAGQMAFLQCGDCHSPGASDGVGPGLKGIAGRRAGTKPGFIYSDAMKKSTLVWDTASLTRYLADPRDTVPGTTMAFPGVDDPKERADLVAFLLTLR